MGYLDYAGLQYLWGKLKEKFAPKSHNHDDRYYTESEMDGMLNSKVNNNETGANGLLSKLSVWTATPTDDTYFMRQDTGGGNSFGRVKFSTIWNYIKGKADGVYQPKGSYATSVHTHDDRYYTESEMNTKLAGKSDASHTHNSIKDAGDNRTLTLAYSKKGLGYDSYSWLAGWNGEELRAVSKDQFATKSHKHYTTDIECGNGNYAGYAGPIEAAHIDVLRANRLAFLPASGIKIEYSIDGGVTWIDYGATDDQKASLFAMRMGSATPFYTGKHTKADDCTAKDQLRVTVTPVDRYVSVNMLYLWVSVAGTTATVDIARSTIGAKETFTNVRTDVPIWGWSGPNEIRFSQGTFGGGSTQTGNQYSYRFTFKNKADGKGSVSVMDIRMYGPSAWGYANSMMVRDHIYSWDTNQNVSFPAQVSATKFNGSATGVRDYNNDNGIIKIGFSGAGLTKDNLTHIAGYTDNGNKIKDVSRGVLQSWLNLNEMINTQLTTGSSTPSDDDFYIAQYAGGGSTTTTYHRRPVSALWTYVKDKADAIYAAKSHTHTKSQITDFPSSLKNPTSLTIQTNSTTAATYDGSAAKTVNITKGNIGLSNVDNTADADKSVKYATSAGSASTATKANTAEVATTGVQDYNSANRTIRIGFSGAGLTTSNLTHIAGYTEDGNKIKDVSKDVLQSWLGLGASAYKKVQSLSAVGHSDWQNQSTDDSFVPTMAFMAYWNGAFNGSGNSNLQYCDRGRFGTIVTKNSGDYASAGHTHSFDSITGKPSTYTPSAHTHDDRYYTETEMNAKLDGKSNTGHTHDDRYYTESEIDSKLSGKSNTSHTHSSIITVADKRNDNTTPDDYRNTFIFQGLKTNSKIGSPSSDTYSYLLGLRGWNDSSGGDSHELALNNTGIYWRHGATTGWNGWNRVYTDNYHPNADYATKANSTDYLNFTVNNEINFTGTPFNNIVFFGYRNSSISQYKFCNGDGSGSLATVVAASFNGKATSAGTADTATNATNATNATTATKLSSSAGSNTQPVYFSDGKPVVIGYTIAKSVPSDAKFTDTTYGVATSTSNGLMSSTDKTKLDDFSRVISIQKQIKMTTDWQDTGIAGNSLETGTYVVQVSGFNSSYTQLYSEIYSGVMSWYSGGTNSENSSEIFLHNAGHADNTNAVYLRTLRTGGNTSLKLQIACRVAATGTDTLTFKFRRLI